MNKHSILPHGADRNSFFDSAMGARKNFVSYLRVASLFSVMLLWNLLAFGQTEILNETLRTGSMPAGWSQTDVSFTTSASGYAKFQDPTSVLETSTLDLSGYTDVELTFDVAKFGSGSNDPITVDVSDDGGATWTAQTFQSAAPSSSTYLTSGPTLITPATASVKIRWTLAASASGKRLRDVVLVGTSSGGGSTPELLATQGSLSGFNYSEGAGPSASQSFDLSGSDLTGDVAFSASGSDFEYSTDDVTFASTLSDLDGSSGSVGPVTIYSRLAVGLSTGMYSDVLIISSPGAADQTVALSGSVTGTVQGLIFSQYTETETGSSPKGVEVWNQTGSTIDFSVTPLEIHKGNNGGALSLDATVSSGILANGEVMVVGSSNIGTYLSSNGLGSVLYESHGFTFNGNDALALVYNGVIEDMIGTEGVDPGSGWTDGSVATNDQNIQLLCDITTGAPAGWSDPGLRYETVGVGSDLTGFGVPPQPCGGPSCSIDNVSVSSISACDGNDNSYTVDIVVEYSNSPGGNLVVNGETFAVGTSPQTVQISGDSDGLDVDVEVSFALDPGCVSSNPALYTAPAPCVVPEPECGNETFSAMGTSTGSYSTFSFIGEDGFNITATDARADQTINGAAVLVRNGSLLIENATGGIGSLTLSTKRVFGGGSGVLDVAVNGAFVGTIPYSDVVQTSTINGIDTNGEVDIEITTPGNGDRIAMDDLIWTCFDGPGLTLSAISGNTDENGGTATFDVSLANEPVGDVVVEVVSTVLSEVSVVNNTLTFDNTNWSAPQTVTLAGVADGLLDGDQTVTINVSVTEANSDPGYLGLSASIDVINEDVNACDAPVWESVSTIFDSEEWTTSGNGFEANGYCGSGCEDDVDAWLVYGPLDLTATTSMQLEFNAVEGFSGTDLVVQYAFDYETDPCPAFATWTEAATITSDGFISVDLSGAAGNTDVYIGIQYSDDGADGYSSWALTDFAIVADVCPEVGTPVVSDCSGPILDDSDCEFAENLPVATFPATSNIQGTLIGATVSGTSGCWDSGVDVFYTFTASSYNHYAITVNPYAGADVVFEVLDGCGGTSITCVDDEFNGTAETTLLTLEAGTYVIRVASYYPSLDDADADFLVNVQEMPFAGVQSNPSNFLYTCNQGGFQMEDFIGATPQTGGNPWIMDYKWLVAEESGGFQSEYQRTEPNYAARISWLGMVPGKTYNVFVSMLINHPTLGPVWTAYLGDFNNPNDIGAAPCTVSTTSSVTQTELLTAYASTLGETYDMCDLVVAQNVQNSENFRWRFDPDVNTPGDEIIYTRGSGNPGVRLSWVPNIQPGTIYQVDVQVQVNGDWSSYGVQKPLEVSAVPQNVAIRAQYCGGTYGTNSIILSEGVCEADYYRFRLIPQGGGPAVYRNSGNYVLFFNGGLANLAPGDYDLQVMVSQNGQVGDFGPICVITIAGPTAPIAGDVAEQRNLAEQGSATLYPNPSSGEEVRVTLNGLTAGNHDVMITVYDLYGKQLSTQGFGHEGETLNRLVRFNEGLSTGVYMVQIVIDGEIHATERMVVN